MGSGYVTWASARPSSSRGRSAVSSGSNTRELIYDCFDQVETLSAAFTLEPGDVISTGTPGGVGVAMRKFLVPGDVVRITIDRVGTIENRVVEEPADAASI